MCALAQDHDANPSGETDHVYIEHDFYVTKVYI